MDAADDRYIGVVFNDGTQLGLVTAAAELIQDDAGNSDFTVKGLVAQDQRGDAACHAARIQYQHYRRFCQRGNGGVAVAAIEIKAVVQALVAFDQRNVRLSGIMPDRGEDFRVGHAMEIQVVAGASGSLSQPHRIDVVRAFLEWLHHQTACCKCSTQANGYSGLAGGFVCCRDQQAGHVSTRSYAPQRRLVRRLRQHPWLCGAGLHTHRRD